MPPDLCGVNYLGWGEPLMGFWPYFLHAHGSDGVYTSPLLPTPFTSLPMGTETTLLCALFLYSKWTPQTAARRCHKTKSMRLLKIVRVRLYLFFREGTRVLAASSSEDGEFGPSSSSYSGYSSWRSRKYRSEYDLESIQYQSVDRSTRWGYSRS